MQKESSYVFQADSKNIGDVYSKADNYLVEYDESRPKKFCVLYFSSNNIYFPNTAEVFEAAIVKNNRFEWYGTRITKAHKHIFLRDIKKQWYLTGVNHKIDDPTKLLAFLKKETEGYEVITMGSSAGGFAAVLYGQLLQAQTIYTFNGQFEINSLLEKSRQDIDPIVFREQNNRTLRKYYDIRLFIERPETVYYFRSKNSKWDIDQYQHISQLPLNTYHFNTDHHGIPFIKSTLPILLNKPIKVVQRYKRKKINPILFSFKVGGFQRTISGLYQIVSAIIKNKFNT